MKTVEELLAIVDDICVEVKSSERLFLVAAMQEQYLDGMIAAQEVMLREMEEAHPTEELIPDHINAAILEQTENERQAKKEEREHYTDYSDQEVTDGK